MASKLIHGQRGLSLEIHRRDYICIFANGSLCSRAVLWSALYRPRWQNALSEKPCAFGRFDETKVFCNIFSTALNSIKGQEFVKYFHLFHYKWYPGFQYVVSMVRLHHHSNMIIFTSEQNYHLKWKCHSCQSTWKHISRIRRFCILVGLFTFFKLKTTRGWRFE